MRLKEPITAATGLALAVLGIGFAAALLLRGIRAPNDAQGIHALYFAAVFLLAGLSAGMGFFDQALLLSPKTEQWVCKIKVALVGMSLYPFMLSLLSLSGSQEWVHRFGPLALGCVLIFVLLVFFLNYHFIGFILFSGIFFLVAYALLIPAYLGGAPVGMLLLGITLCGLASVLQATGRSLPPLNHNDLYHLVGIIAWIALFIGALRL